MWTITQAREAMARDERAFPGQDFVIITHPRDGHQVRDVHHTSGHPAVEGRACRHCGQVGMNPRCHASPGYGCAMYAERT